MSDANLLFTELSNQEHYISGVPRKQKWDEKSVQSEVKGPLVRRKASDGRLETENTKYF